MLVKIYKLYFLKSIIFVFPNKFIFLEYFLLINKITCRKSLFLTNHPCHHLLTFGPCFKMQKLFSLKLLEQLGHASLAAKRYINYVSVALCVCICDQSLSLLLLRDPVANPELQTNSAFHVNACFAIRSESFHFHFVVGALANVWKGKLEGDLDLSSTMPFAPAAFGP